jgi:hypothetical protein
MNFRITGLSPEPFRALFGLSDEDLARNGARRYVADKKPGFPDRIGIRDVEPGEAVLLVHYEHQPADTPYRASHAVFVREGADTTYDADNEIPEALRGRALSVRAFDANHMMVDADLGDGTALESLIERLFSNPDVVYLHAHYATRGCYAARIDRA